MPRSTSYSKRWLSSNECVDDKFLAEITRVHRGHGRRHRPRTEIGYNVDKHLAPHAAKAAMVRYFPVLERSFTPQPTNGSRVFLSQNTRVRQALTEEKGPSSVTPGEDLGRGGWPFPELYSVTGHGSHPAGGTFSPRHTWRTLSPREPSSGLRPVRTVPPHCTLVSHLH